MVGRGIEGREITGLLQTILPTLNEFTEGAGTTEVGSLYQYFTTRIEKGDFRRACRLGTCRALK